MYWRSLIRGPEYGEGSEARRSQMNSSSMGKRVAAGRQEVGGVIPGRTCEMEELTK